MLDQESENGKIFNETGQASKLRVENRQGGTQHVGSKSTHDTIEAMT